MAYQDPTFGLTVPGVRQAPPAVVRRDNLGFAPGLQIMQPARDAQNLRDLRDTEAMYEDQRAITSAINADTQNLREFNQGTAAAEQRGQAYRDQVAADTAARTTPNAAPTYQPAQRGNYNMTNTDPSKLAKPVGAGLTFGFGGGNETASQYLARMNAQDRLAAQDHAQWQRTMEQDIARTRVMGQLDDAKNDPARYRQLLAQARLLQGDTELANRQNLGLQGINRDLLIAGGQQQTARDVAQLNAQSALASRLGAAELSGQYGLAAAQARRDGLLGSAAIKAQGSPGLEAKNLGEAQLSAARLGLIQQALENGDLHTAQSLAVGQLPGVGALVTDAAGNPIGQRDQSTGMPVTYTPAQLEQLRLARQQVNKAAE